jgi:DNA-binding protein H-NS
MAQWRKFSGEAEFNPYLAGWAIAATVILATLMFIAHVRHKRYLERVLLICGVIPLRVFAEAGLLPIADVMSARIRSSTAPVPSLWNTRNQAQLLVDKTADDER